MLFGAGKRIQAFVAFVPRTERYKPLLVIANEYDLCTVASQMGAFSSMTLNGVETFFLLPSDGRELQPGDMTAAVAKMRTNTEGALFILKPFP
jgi:hypothetical protein